MRVMKRDRDNHQEGRRNQPVFLEKGQLRALSIAVFFILIICFSGISIAAYYLKETSEK